VRHIIRFGHYELDPLEIPTTNSSPNRYGNHMLGLLNVGFDLIGYAVTIIVEGIKLSSPGTFN
jgi:hypothetical protein